MWVPTWETIWKPMQVLVRIYHFGDARGNDKGSDMGFDVVADMNAL